MKKLKHICKECGAKTRTKYPSGRWNRANKIPVDKRDVFCMKCWLRKIGKINMQKWQERLREMKNKQLKKVA